MPQFSQGSVKWTFTRVVVRIKIVHKCETPIHIIIHCGHAGVGIFEPRGHLSRD